MPSGQQGRGGGRSAGPGRHGHKEGGGRGSRSGGHRWRLRQRGDHGGGLNLRDAEPLGQGCEGAGGGRAKGAEGRPPRGQEDLHPWVGLALAQAAQPSLAHLEGVGLQLREAEAQPIVRGRQGAVGVHPPLAGGPGCPSEAPLAHRGLERGLTGRDQELQLVGCQAGAIEERCGAIRHVSAPHRRHR